MSTRKHPDNESAGTASEPASGYYEYFNYLRHPSLPPKRLDAIEPTSAVVIAGGGPVGLTFALDLARFGIASIVLEEDDTFSYGSRAGCISRRSQEVFARVGAGGPIQEKGLPWKTGVCFYRDREVLRFDMPSAATDRFSPMLNIPQNYIEQYLAEMAERSELIDLRWQNKATAVRQTLNCNHIDIATPFGGYTLEAPWLVACDGARSVVRQSLGLKLEGESYEGKYLIADIRLVSKRPTGRLAWFDPPSNPGSTVLMHKLTDEIWRFDYQLMPDEDEASARKPEAVRERIANHLAFIGERTDWELSWISVYKANALTLAKYRHGRVMFLGDAAHPIPIFGVRGLNSGLDDAHNLAWKLAAVAKGKCSESLLDSFSIERREATDNNLRNARKSTAFMSPPTFAHDAMRKAVLSLASNHPWLAQLINPRQTSASSYTQSPLNSDRDSRQGFDGPLPGDPMTECPVALPDGSSSYITALVQEKPVLFLFNQNPAELDRWRSAISTLDRLGLDCTMIGVSQPGADASGDVYVDADLTHRLFGSGVPDAYLVRPDGYVAARWNAATQMDVERALRKLYPMKEQT